jgi:hypothetical protein
LTGRIARLTSREKVWMLPFSEQVYAPVFFQLPGVGKGAGTGKGLATPSSIPKANKRC